MCVLLCACAAAGQSLAEGTLDLAVPDSPAFAVLNLNPLDIVRPVTPTALVTNLLNGVDKNGHFQTGFAIDTAPYLLWRGRTATLQQYQQSTAIRFISRMQMSTALVRGATADDESARFAVGAHFTIFNQDDPRMDQEFVRALAAAASTALQRIPMPPPSATTEQLESYENEVAQLTSSLASAARERRRREAWNPTNLVVGVARAWRSPEGRVQDLDAEGLGLWTSLGYGFRTVPGLDDSAHLVVHVRWRSDVTALSILAPPESIQAPEKWLAGVRFQFGGENTTLSFEGSRVKPQGSDDTSSRFSLALERRVLPGTWLQLSFGGQSNPIAESDTFVLSQLKWSFVER
jgi:hypothetical protein